MTERISIGRIYDQARINIGRSFEKLFRSQMMLSTGKSLITPSDNPADTGRLFGLISQQEGIARYQRSIDTSRAQVEAGASHLQEISNIVQSVREAAVQGANGTLSESDRASIAEELDQLLQSMVGAANVQVEGRSIFGGTRTNVLPFESVLGSDGLQRVVYGGNGELQHVDVGPGVRTALNVPGSRIFRPGPRGQTTFRGLTGVQAGPGSDSVLGGAILRVSHTQTLYGTAPGPGGQDPATGLRPAASGAVDDTVLGTGHGVTLTTDATGAGTISLDGGGSVSFTGTETDLVVKAPDGSVIHVDVTALAPNITGANVAVDGRGTFSLDGGLTAVPINFASTAQQVVNSETGEVLHLDATGVKRAGVEEVSANGTFDLFSAVISIRDALRDDTLGSQELNALILTRLDELDRGHTDLLTGLAEMGARSARLDSASSRLDDLDITIADLRSRIEDADLGEVTVDLKRYEALYQASLLMASRVGNLTLMSYLR